MTPLIGFDLYRTENLSIESVPYTVRFFLRKDREEYMLSVTNDSNGNQVTYAYSNEVASDFEQQHGQKLEVEIKKIIEADMNSGVI